MVKGSLATPLIDPQHHVSILAMMKRLIGYTRNSFASLAKRRRQDGLAAVEYEAVCLISYEGRAAYGRARQQAFFAALKEANRAFGSGPPLPSRLIGGRGPALREPTNNRDRMRPPTRR
jgi:hypothetical protein